MRIFSAARLYAHYRRLGINRRVSLRWAWEMSK